MPQVGKNLLSELAVKNAKPKNKAYKLRDGEGLFLVVEVTGKKWWKFRCTFAKKETSFSFGEYPSVTLAQARVERNKVNSRIANQINPGAMRKSDLVMSSGEGSFEAVAREWHTKFLHTWTEEYGKRILTKLEQRVFPYIGKRPISEISSVEILDVLQRIEKTSLDLAHRMKYRCGQIFRYGNATGRSSNDPTISLKGALPPTVSKHMAAPTDPKEVSQLLRMINGYQGSLIVQCALKLAPLVFVRPGELRQAEWKDFDLEQAEWRFFVSKTKTEHIVPLSRQSLEILKEVYLLTGHDRYVFPSARSVARPMSNNTINAAMRRMGIDTKTELTGHGFRAMARTILDEVLGFRPDFIEHQLSHAVKDPNGRAYNRTAHLSARKEMMQAWADYLDTLTAGGEMSPNRVTN